MSEKDGKIQHNLDSPKISGKENHVTEISFTSDKENIVCLYRACDAEGLSMKANQEEMLRWY